MGHSFRLQQHTILLLLSRNINRATAVFADLSPCNAFGVATLLLIKKEMNEHFAEETH